MSSFWDRLTESEQQDCIEKNVVRIIAQRKGYSPRGIVRQKWTVEIYPAIKGIMNDHGNRVRIYGTSSKHPICSCRLFMLDCNPSLKPARPTIVVRCIDKKFARRTVDLLEKMPTLKKSVLGFDFLISQEEIRLAADASEGVSPAAQQIGQSLCGARVLISPSQKYNSWTRTTVGGVIIIDDRLYALTAAHAFFRVQEDAKPKHSDVMSSNGTASTISSADGQDYDDDIDPPEPWSLTQSTGDGSQTETTQVESRSIYLDDRTSSAQSPSIDAGRAVEKPASVRDENLIGTVRTSANSLYQRTSQLNLEDDWALFEISPSRFQTSNIVEAPNGNILYTANAPQRDPNGPVLVAAGVSGVLQTECSGLLSGIILPDSRKMLDAWTLPEPCMPGDCGAWVLDSQNGDVFGMVVATSDELQESYCLPISTIFESILASRPGATTISFPGAAPSSQPYEVPPSHLRHSPRMPSSNHLEPEESSEASRIPRESADPTSHTTSPETGDYKPGHQPTATSEQLPSDATDPVLLVPTEEPHILQTRELVTEAPESNPAAEIDAKHSEPSQSKWESVVIEEFPTAALESLGVPWRKVEGEETHIMIGREIMTALRKARAQQPSADMERPMSRVGVTLAEDLDTNAQRTNVEPDSGPLALLEEERPLHRARRSNTESPSEILIEQEPMAASEPELPGKAGTSGRGAYEESEDSHGGENHTEYHVIGGEIVLVTHRFTDGETLLPTTLGEDRVLHALGYSFYVQGGTYHIAEALEKIDIDEVVESSRKYRFSQGAPVNKRSGSRVFRRSPDSIHSPRQLILEKYDLQFEEEIRNELSTSPNFPYQYARALGAASLELIQKFRENRAKLAEALTLFLGKGDRPSRSEDIHNEPPRVVAVEESTHRSRSPPSRRLPSPETNISRTTRYAPGETEERFIEREVHYRHPPRRAYTGLTGDGDRYSLLQREGPQEQIEIRHEGERNGRAYDAGVIIDHNEETRRDVQSAAPEATPVNVTPGGGRGSTRHEQEGAEYYNKRALERSYLGEAYNGATRDWAIVDVPPGTERVTMQGAGGGKQDIWWHQYDGMRRAAFYPKGNANISGGRDDIGRKATEGTSKAYQPTEPGAVERDYHRGEDVPETGKKQGKERDWEKTVRFEGPQAYTSNKGQKLIKDSADFGDEELEDIVKKARAVHRQPERAPRVAGKDREELIEKLGQLGENDLNNIMREARAARRAPSRQVEREREEITIKKDDRSRSDVRGERGDDKNNFWGPESDQADTRASRISASSYDASRASAPSYTASGFSAPSYALGYDDSGPYRPTSWPASTSLSWPASTSLSWPAPTPVSWPAPAPVGWPAPTSWPAPASWFATAPPAPVPAPPAAAPAPAPAPSPSPSPSPPPTPPARDQGELVKRVEAMLLKEKKERQARDDAREAALKAEAAAAEAKAYRAASDAKIAEEAAAKAAAAARAEAEKEAAENAAKAKEEAEKKLEEAVAKARREAEEAFAMAKSESEKTTKETTKKKAGKPKHRPRNPPKMPMSEHTE